MSGGSGGEIVKAEMSGIISTFIKHYFSETFSSRCRLQLSSAGERAHLDFFPLKSSVTAEEAMISDCLMNDAW